MREPFKRLPGCICSESSVASGAHDFIHCPAWDATVEILNEYDFTKGVRGVYAARYAKGHTVKRPRLHGRLRAWLRILDAEYRKLFAGWCFVLVLTGCAARERVTHVYVCPNGNEAPAAAKCTPETRTAVELRWKTRAKEALVAGDKFFDLANFHKAYAWYVQSYAIDPEVETLYRAGQAARLAGQKRIARWMFRVYLVRSRGEGETAYRTTAERWVQALARDAGTPGDGEEVLVWTGSEVGGATCEVRALEETQRLLKDLYLDRAGAK